ncbi:28S ribosomal protein S7, mitochondrial [Scyliorhinus canicula]|uniref:28S ribosomal protein S7, mitochondrial n=1 Tax=Scyliorhinus canicula TaxID=7830 RepID=UPI0018F75428|nr:28S ribosomal protein S7, mitochondrial [Scyliorhinus canicula]
MAGVLNASLKMAAGWSWRSQLGPVIRAGGGCLNRRGSIPGPPQIWVIPVRGSRYNPHYLEPELNKEWHRIMVTELGPEESAALELRAVRPIKAATINQSSSVFSDPLTSKFINMMMQRGQKLLSRSIMSKTFETIKRKQIESYHKAPESEKDTIECNPHKIFHQALENCMPVIGLTNIQRGGKSYQVPTPLTDNRRRFLAMKWFITECSENRHRRTHMYEKLSQELLAAFNNEGNVIKRKRDLHKMAEANRAYAHYRWW